MIIMHKVRLAVFLGAVGLAVGSVLWWSRQRVDPAALRAGVPPHPAMTGQPAEFVRRITVCEDALKRGSGSPAILAELGQLYQANGFLAEAALCYGQLVLIQPAQARWPHRMACLYAGFGRLDEALSLWQRTLRADQDYLPARIRMGDVLLKLNRSAEAAEAYAVVIKREPTNPYALVGLARIDILAGRWTEAKSRLQQATASSDFAIGADLLATVYEKLGDKNAADTLQARGKSSGAFFDLPDPWMDEIFEDCFDVYRVTVAAGFADHAGNTAMARRLIERALQLAPNDVAALYQSGTFAEKRKDYAQARRNYEDCVRLAPDYDDGWARLIGLHLITGDTLAAQRALNEGLINCPTSAILQLERASRLSQAGRYEEALPVFEAVLALKPNYADALTKMANTCFQLGREEEGINALRRALMAEPEYPPALTTLAYAAIQKGDEPAAREWLRRVRLQVRVPREMADELANAYQARFGRRL